jgi:hypothetical protein
VCCVWVQCEFTGIWKNYETHSKGTHACTHTHTHTHTRTRTRTRAHAHAHAHTHTHTHTRAHTHKMYILTSLWSWSDPELSTALHTVREAIKQGCDSLNPKLLMPLFSQIHCYLSFSSLQCGSSSTAERSFIPESPG